MEDVTGAPVPDRLSLAIGEEVEIQLRGLGTSGYRWRDESNDDSGILSVGWRLGPVALSSVGVSAPEIVTIRACRVGTAEVKLVQSQPWETDCGPVDSHTIVVTVHGSAR